LNVLQESLSATQDKENELNFKLKSSIQLAEQSEIKLARAAKEFSEKEKQYSRDLEMASQRAEEALKTLQVIYMYIYICGGGGSFLFYVYLFVIFIH
jgi:intein/homing endonuclease